MTLISGLAAIFGSIAAFIGRKRPKYIELASPILQWTTVIVSMLINYGGFLGEVTLDMLWFQVLFASWIYCQAAFFGTCSWLCSFVSRSLYYVVIQSYT